MEWLSQNWIFVLLVVGVILMMRRGGMACGPFGGGGHHGGHGEGRDEGARRPESPVDPVSGQPVDPKTAVATVYQGRAYYFATKENRERFEAAPEQYARAPGEHPEHEVHGERHHRHGC